jgi:hypothetical protein
MFMNVLRSEIVNVVGRRHRGLRHRGLRHPATPCWNCRGCSMTSRASRYIHRRCLRTRSTLRRCPVNPS